MSDMILFCLLEFTHMIMQLPNFIINPQLKLIQMINPSIFQCFLQYFYAFFLDSTSTAAFCHSQKRFNQHHRMVDEKGSFSSLIVVEKGLINIVGLKVKVS